MDCTTPCKVWSSPSFSIHSTVFITYIVNVLFPSPVSPFRGEAVTFDC